MNLDFKFYVTGLLDGILAALREPMVAIGGKGFVQYSGELDDEKKVEEAVGALISSAKFPLTMIGYAGGDTNADPAEAPVMGESRQFQHICKLPLILASDNVRGEDARRDYVLGMISVVWDTLTDLRLYKVAEGIDKPVLLNSIPIETGEIGRIVVPDVTAYKVDLYTAFRWTSPDRTEEAVAVNEFILGLQGTASHSEPGSNLPGIEYEVSGQ